MSASSDLTAQASPASVRPWRSFTVSFVLCFAVALTWAAATPMFGVPDEVSHMVRAAAAVRGDVDGRMAHGSVLYRALAVMRPGHRDSDRPARGDVCYAGVRSESASCLVLSGNRGEQLLPSSAGSYPPAYYFIAGWPSLVFKGVRALYAMRAASAAVFASLIALATISFPPGRRGAPAFVALAVAATPMTWFLGASVTPSSIAVGAGVAAWCGGYRLVSDQDAAPSALAWRFGLPLCLLLLVRRDSIFWGGVIVAALAALVGWARLRELVKSRHVWGWAVASLACAVLAAKSGGSYASSIVGLAATTGSARDAFGSLLQYLQEMVGVLGWLDTALPTAAYLLWYLVFGALLVALLALGRVRIVLVTVGVIVAIAAMIVVFGAQVFPYFQGRYALPAAVGVPLLAGLGLAADERPWRFPFRAVSVVLAAACVVHVLAFYQQFRRYARPGEATWSLLGDVQWRPPTAPIPVLVVLNFLTLGGLLVSWGWLMRRPDGPEHAPSPDAALAASGALG